MFLCLSRTCFLARTFSGAMFPCFGPELSGTESAILNRESGDSASRDSNRAIPRSRLNIDRSRFGLATFCCDSTHILLLAAEILAISGLRFCESCDSRFAIRAGGPKPPSSVAGGHVGKSCFVSTTREAAKHHSRHDCDFEFRAGVPLLPFHPLKRCPS